MSRQCKCGGVLHEGRFLDGRTSLKCADCARYEIFRPVGEAPKGAPADAGGDLFAQTGEQAHPAEGARS